MLSLPLELVVVLFLGFLLLRLLSENRDWTVQRLAFAAILGLGMVHGTLSSLIWSYDLTALRPALPIVASLLPVTTWLAFCSMAQRSVRPTVARLALHAAPTIVLVPLAFTGSLLIDPIIILSFLTHGALLLRMGAAGPDAFAQAQLHRSLSVARAAQGTGLLLALNACVDIAIIVDFQLAQGRHVPTLLSAISVIILLLLVITAARGTEGAADDADDTPESSATNALTIAPAAATTLAETKEHAATAARIDALMRESRLFTDPDLTLTKIARKAGLPAREISTAINRHHSMNVSQYVNGLRLSEACRLLASTDATITSIQFDSGFQTKFNFKREFRRQYGCSPTQWRAGQSP